MRDRVLGISFYPFTKEILLCVLQLHALTEASESWIISPSSVEEMIWSHSRMHQLLRTAQVPMNSSLRHGQMRWFHVRLRLCRFSIFDCLIRSSEVYPSLRSGMELTPTSIHNYRLIFLALSKGCFASCAAAYSDRIFRRLDSSSSSLLLI